MMLICDDLGANPNSSPPGCSTALAAAVESDDREMVKVLLAGGADPAKKPWGGQGAMSVAVRKGDQGMLKLFATGGR
jgi:hypothetical protein